MLETNREMLFKSRKVDMRRIDSRRTEGEDTNDVDRLKNER